jgi:hypothetical protein
MNLFEFMNHSPILSFLLVLIFLGAICIIVETIASIAKEKEKKKKEEKGTTFKEKLKTLENSRTALNEVLAEIEKCPNCRFNKMEKEE